MDKSRFAKDIMNQLAFKVTKGVYPGTEQVGSVSLNSNFSSFNDSSAKQSYKPIGPHFLVVFTGSDIGLSERINELKKLRERGCSFDIAYSGSALEILDTAAIEDQIKPVNVYDPESSNRLIYDKIVSDAQAVIAPVVTQNTAVKFALGIQDDFIPMILWRSLWLDKPVFMDMEGILTHIGDSSKKTYLQQMMREYVDKLQKMGVKLIRNGSYIDEITKSFFGTREVAYGESQRTEKMVLTEKDVLGNTNTKEIIVPIKAIVTPLAYETAKELGIKIIKK
jgi:hypothetical protein